MTTTDARKRNRDMRDAHETARARDAAWMLGALDGTGGPRTRTHHIDTETGEFTLLDNQEDTMDAPNEVKIHVTIDREQVREAARLAAELFITEYASRLVEAVDPNYLDDEPVVDCGRPPRVHVNPERTDWLDEPIPVPRPEPACVCGSVETVHCCPEPAPADVDPDEDDPDEVLADAIEWACAHTSLSDGTWLHAARAAREHIEGERAYAALVDQVLPEKAEAERDALRERLDALRAGIARLHSNVEKWHARLERDNADGLIREALRDLADLARDTERAES